MKTAESGLISDPSLARHLEDLPARGRKAHVISLGCPKNLVDTERYVSVLDSQGFKLTQSPEEADLLLINTCSFIDQAKAESIETLLEISEAKGEHQSLVVAGCLVDRYRDDLVREFPEVDLWVDLPTFGDFPRELAELAPADLPKNYVALSLSGTGITPAIPWAGFQRTILTPRHTAYLKISEGCDHTCAFCAIPSFKGKQRSVPMDILLAEARALAGQGARELTLIGQDTVAYGRDLGSRKTHNLRALLESLNDIAGIDWIRVLYTYPTRLAEELEWAYRNLPKLVAYLDLPLQHLSDRILERMRRGTPYETILNHVSRLRATIPNLVVRSTCIVGFPGETPEDFETLKERFRELAVDHLGVFRYSDEEGTRGVELGEKVPLRSASSRLKAMTRWAAQHCQDKAGERIGEIHQVLVDGPCAATPELVKVLGRSTRKKWWRGRWYGQAPEIDGSVYFAAGGIQEGGFVQVRLEGASYPDYFGSVV
jgi:ribosomal protein S12 methylthiotransferase